MTVLCDRDAELRPPPSPGSRPFSGASGRLGRGIARSWLGSWLLCEGGLNAALGVETVADLARFGADNDCRGEITAEMEGEDAWRAERPSPILELATVSKTTLAEAERDDNVDALDA